MFNVNAITNIWKYLKLLFHIHVIEDIVEKKKRDKLLFILGGHILFQTVSAALRFDLFTLLTKRGSLTLDQIMKDLDLKEKPARILLLGCTALGLIRKREDHYGLKVKTSIC
jgi:hypothetical protein